MPKHDTKSGADQEPDYDERPYYKVKQYTHEGGRVVWQLLERGICVHEYDTPSQAEAAAKRNNRRQA